MTRDDGGPAFPFTHGPGGAEEGMSIRDWFAGQASIGLYPYLSDINEGGEIREVDLANAVALVAYQIADAMIAERAKAEGSTP